MPNGDGIIQSILPLLGQLVRFRGDRFRLVEVLEEPARIVLAPVGRVPTIVADSYGHPAGTGHEFVELRLFDDAGELSEDIRLVWLEEHSDQ